MKQLKFAACTLCKNEEHNVNKWLHKTKDFDYRIVVDTGSIDRTVELFSKADNVIFVQKIFNPFQFNTVRNYILTLVPEEVDWIFWPDLDEYYETDWRNEMENISPEATRVLYHSILYRDGVKEVITENPETGTTMDCKVHKNKKYEWVKPVHEFLSFIGNKEEIVQAKIIRIHCHKSTQERSDLYYNIAVTFVETDPTDDYIIWFAFLGAYDRKDPYKVIKYGTLYLELTKPNTDFRVMAYRYISEAYLFLSQQEQGNYNAT